MVLPISVRVSRPYPTAAYTCALPSGPPRKSSFSFLAGTRSHKRRTLDGSTSLPPEPDRRLQDRSSTGTSGLPCAGPPGRENTNNRSGVPSSRATLDLDTKSLAQLCRPQSCLSAHPHAALLTRADDICNHAPGSGSAGVVMSHPTLRLPAAPLRLDWRNYCSIARPSSPRGWPTGKAGRYPSPIASTGLRANLSLKGPVKH